MKYTTLFFDLDDTLYDSANGLWSAIRDRMSDYMQQLLGLPTEQVDEIRRSYYESYGTTLKGLQIHHKIDPLEFLAYVHDLPLTRYIQPDPELRDMLLRLGQRKYIFTNADLQHANRVLSILGVSDCFLGVIDVTTLGYFCKPDPEAFRRALSIAGEPQPSRCILLDDTARNITGASEYGLTTVYVNKNGANPAAHYSISRIIDLPDALPDLWPATGVDPSLLDKIDG